MNEVFHDSSANRQHYTGRNYSWLNHERLIRNLLLCLTFSDQCTKTKCSSKAAVEDGSCNICVKYGTNDN